MPGRRTGCSTARNDISTTGGIVLAGCTIVVDPGDPPAGALGVVVVVTTTGSTSSGYTEACPCGTALPPPRRSGAARRDVPAPPWCAHRLSGTVCILPR
ncbi:MAG: hypothetical protein R2705_23465 [Ilumatobacteraceae bacterium]